MSVFAFGVAGCGDSGDSSSADSSAETSESATAESGATESDTAESSGESATLDDALAELRGHYDWILPRQSVAGQFIDALACLTAEGIDAKDQSSNTSGEVIGIDYSGGRTTISFEESEDDAEITAMVAEDYGEVIQVGSVVASIDPSADTADTAVIESCITA